MIKHTFKDPNYVVDKWRIWIFTLYLIMKRKVAENVYDRARSPPQSLLSDLASVGCSLSKMAT